MPYAKELGTKEQQVRGLIREVVQNQDLEYTWEGIKCSPVQFAYRNKMEFTFGDEELNGPLALGMHKRGSMNISYKDLKVLEVPFPSIEEQGQIAKEYEDSYKKYTESISEAEKQWKDTLDKLQKF